MSASSSIGPTRKAILKPIKPPATRTETPSEQQLTNLRECYRIHGDGIARLNLPEAVKNPAFQASVRRLKNLKV